jgi:uncharacterized protein YlxW (UPF0749 family)
MSDRRKTGEGGMKGWETRRANAAAQVTRDEKHYQAAMAMSEKHRKLWVSACQEVTRLKAEVERLRAEMRDSNQLAADNFERAKKAEVEVERLRAANGRILGT